MFYQNFIKPIFFQMDPEKAHYLAMDLWTIVSKIPGVGFYYKTKNKQIAQPTVVAGIQFPNRIGLAAGFDKNGKWMHALALLGFGHIEVGTVTPLPQPGNDKPRLFRLPKNNALINRMGFNNDGVDALAQRLKKRPTNVVIGGNIGKNKWTPNDEAYKDYLICFEKLHGLVDYFVVNVSSPNTPGLRALQEKEPLLQVLMGLQFHELQKKQPIPIFLKIAPDLTEEALEDIIDVVTQSQIAGIIATNTTIDRQQLSYSKEHIESIGAGGVSGEPVKQKSLHIIQTIRSKNPNLTIIGVGGIFDAADAKASLTAGASLVQVYTGFIYQGPQIAQKIGKGIAAQ
jgi:dihydroorotate dehydrogenase